MHKSRFWTFLSLLLIASMVLVGCAKPTPEKVVVTKEVKVTQVVTKEVEKVVTKEVNKVVTATPESLGTVVIGTNAEFRPMEYVDKSGKIVGFDIDLMNELAKRAGFTPKYVNTKWDGIFVALANGEFDAVISSVTITDERKKVVDFTAPYFNAGQIVAVSKDNTTIKGAADLSGHKVGVQLGTTGDIATSKIKGVTVKRYDEITLAFQALKNGDVDAVVNDAPVSADIIKANPELNAKLVGKPFTTELYGIAVNKKHKTLLNALNAALATVQTDGTYDKIYNKWFSTSQKSAAKPLGTVVVGTNAEFRPMEYVDKDNKIVGFDVDLMNALAKRANFTPKYVNTKWDGIFVALANGEFDAVVSSVTITDERKKVVNFTDPYFNAGQIVAVSKDNTTIKGAADLSGHKVGVQLGTTGDIATSKIKGVTVKRYDEITLAFQALKNGDVDAVVNDAPVSADIIKANPELNAKLVGKPFTSELYGIAVNKKKTDLLKALNAALKAVKDDGTYNKIYTKWFGTNP